MCLLDKLDPWFLALLGCLMIYAIVLIVRVVLEEKSFIKLLNRREKQAREEKYGRGK